ncbi:hypothetical protein K2X14_08405 [Acetobacter sp. TBRC 12305]|uniref:DUF3325 domain-containing protein n=1 Tax=Acetobacter garciniae TaxID=2817435 RepID=A0A939KMC8_9PROT|nr:hypothetical protein [Acetobacter garciniae]MBO1325178.1 hypothetical protein [Acetobacter garciniae]MBX0344851.1 hypothetical protein [Acetobacter garciniae]
MTGAVWLAAAMAQTACLLWAATLAWPRQKLGTAPPSPSHRHALRAGAALAAGLALWASLMWRPDSGWPLWIMLLSTCSLLTAVGLAILPGPRQAKPAIRRQGRL